METEKQDVINIIGLRIINTIDNKPYISFYAILSHYVVFVKLRLFLLLLNILML